MQGIPPVDLLTHLGAHYCGRYHVAGISQGYAGGVYCGALTRCACASIPRQDGDEALLSPGEDGQELDRFACRFPKVDLFRWDVTGFSCLESHIGFPVQREGNVAFEDIKNLISGMIVRRAREIRSHFGESHDSFFAWRSRQPRLEQSYHGVSGSRFMRVGYTLYSALIKILLPHDPFFENSLKTV
jgi:hypothetical protein